MKTVDRLVINAPISRVWNLASAVEQWPTHLPHYRWVRRLDGEIGSDGIVEMAAWRPFGPLQWPTWWCSTMLLDHARHEVRYQHIKGITTEMDVLWSVVPLGQERTEVTIVHLWDGPPWPAIGGLIARTIIGPVFVHGIASRTLAGLARVAESS